MIQGICVIPVNIAMMCFIWNESQNNKYIKINNLSDLYTKVVKKLSKRYFFKFVREENETIEDMWRKIKLEKVDLDQLIVL